MDTTGNVPLFEHKNFLTTAENMMQCMLRYASFDSV